MEKLPSPVTIVTGYFDILCASSARDLQNVRNRTPEHPLAVIVYSYDLELMAVPERVEMTAALRAVDYVVIVLEAWISGILMSLHTNEIVRFEEADSLRRNDLIQRVRRRYL